MPLYTAFRKDSRQRASLLRLEECLIKAVKYNDTEDYSHMTLLGIDGVFSPVRIQANTLPEGFYRYELSSGKGIRFGSVQEKRAFRHAGDFISRDPLPLDEESKKKLTAGDWTLNTDRKFDFESFWAHKRSIDLQISNATYKRDLAMGKTPSGRDVYHSEILDQENTIL